MFNKIEFKEFKLKYLRKLGRGKSIRMSAWKLFDYFKNFILTSIHRLWTGLKGLAQSSCEPSGELETPSGLPKPCSRSTKRSRASTVWDALSSASHSAVGNDNLSHVWCWVTSCCILWFRVVKYRMVIKYIDSTWPLCTCSSITRLVLIFSLETQFMWNFKNYSNRRKSEST